MPTNNTSTVIASSKPATTTKAAKPARKIITGAKPSAKPSVTVAPPASVAAPVVTKPTANMPVPALLPASKPADDTDRMLAGHARKQSRHPFAYAAAGTDVRDNEYLAFFGTICRLAGKHLGITGADIAKHALAAGAYNVSGKLKFPSATNNLKNNITDGGRQSRLVYLGYATRDAASGNALSATKLALEYAPFSKAYRGA